MPVQRSKFRRVVPAVAAAAALAAGSYAIGRRAGRQSGGGEISRLQSERNRLIRAVNAPPRGASEKAVFDFMQSIESERDLRSLRDYLRQRTAVHTKRVAGLLRKPRWSESDVLAAHKTMAGIGELLPQAGQLRDDALHSALAAAHGSLFGRLQASGRLER